jgi:hypothetical protein
MIRASFLLEPIRRFNPPGKKAPRAIDRVLYVDRSNPTSRNAAELHRRSKSSRDRFAHFVHNRATRRISRSVSPFFLKRKVQSVGVASPPKTTISFMESTIAIDFGIGIAVAVLTELESSSMLPSGSLEPFRSSRGVKKQS